MPDRRVVRLPGGMLTFALALLALWSAGGLRAEEAASSRITPLVRAVKQASPAVVNIQGQKTVSEQLAGTGHHDRTRQVNGMGTGVVIDPRGYILTNHHVVDGVRQINVTFADRRKYVAELVAFDQRTDLAVIRVRTSHVLPTITMGTSGDLMPAEQVVAVGNAYGYEHTVTVGIISALHRDVQVSDTQAYDDLIQTDASINPGNSGGPLLNIDGEMIGVNVAVRAGAQGIGFAIPVDAAMDIAARLISAEELESRWHGLTVESDSESQQLVVRQVAAGSPAEEAGFRPGDVLRRIDDLAAQRRLDVERAMLGINGRKVPVEVERDGQRLALNLTTEPMPSGRPGAARVASSRSSAWETLGVRLEPEPASTFANGRSKYRGGLRIVGVRPNSPAEREGLAEGDILVGMHRWQTASLEDVNYILTRANLPRLGQVRFYIVRNHETLYTDINVATAGTAVRR